MGPMLGIAVSPIGSAGETAESTVMIPCAPTTLTCKRREEELLGCVAMRLGYLLMYLMRWVEQVRIFTVRM